MRVVLVRFAWLFRRESLPGERLTELLYHLFVLIWVLNHLFSLVCLCIHIVKEIVNISLVWFPFVCRGGVACWVAAWFLRESSRRDVLVLFGWRIAITVWVFTVIFTLIGCFLLYSLILDFLRHLLRLSLLFFLFFFDVLAHACHSTEESSKRWRLNDALILTSDQVRDVIHVVGSLMFRARIRVVVLAVVGVCRGYWLSIKEDVFVFDLMEWRDVGLAAHQADFHLLFLFVASWWYLDGGWLGELSTTTVTELLALSLQLLYFLL